MIRSMPIQENFFPADVAAPVPTWMRGTQDAPATKPLRPFQISALDAVKASLRAGHRRVMLKAPTGAGKTVLAADIIRTARDKGRRVTFVVNAISLVDQTVEKFWQAGIRCIGVTQGDHEMTDARQPVQVCSVQTLMRRAIPPADLVLIDEAHNWFQFYAQWMTDPAWEKIPFIGLSATPYTKGLGKYYTDLVIASSTQELIGMNFLSPFKVFAPGLKADLSKVRELAGDYHEGDLAEAMNQPELVADVVKTWLDFSLTYGRRPTLCYAVDCAHARKLQEQFLAAGVPCAYMDAATEIEERREIGDKFARREIEVVSNVGVLTTGIDWDVRCIILDRPTKSKILFQQIIGRGLRTAPGKDFCIAQGEMVLTDRGLVRIERVTAEMRVWDGEEFVHHGGAICRGEKEVISYAGLRATPDHKVWTEEGWRTLGEAAGRKLGIAATGVGGEAVWIGHCDFIRGENPTGGERQGGAVRADDVRIMQRGGVDLAGELARGADEGMPALQSAAKGASLAHAEAGERATALHQSRGPAVQRLWRPGNPIQISDGAVRGPVDCGAPGVGTREADRSDRQQQALRTGELAVGDLRGEHGQPAAKTAKVFDLINAGPRHRFTVSGLLVHNCLILDHSPTHSKLGYVTDVDEQNQELDGGVKKPNQPKPKKERVPTECPKCHFLRPVGSRACPNCKFVPIEVKQSEIENAEGELAEFEGKKEKFTKEQKAAFYGELLTYCERKGYKPGWAAAKFKDKFGVWPNAYRAAERKEPTAETLSWIRSRNIAWAKRKPA